MAIDSIMAATRFGLAYERLRLEAASRNIAMANTPSAPGRSARLAQVAVPGGARFGAALEVDDPAAMARPALVDTDVPVREVHDPSDPAADANGMVAYPRVDLVEQMGTLVEASRAYEANVRAFNTLRSMALHALDIGSGS
jgi:flagellar basal-body rod protein FlgC